MLPIRVYNPSTHIAKISCQLRDACPRCHCDTGGADTVVVADSGGGDTGDDGRTRSHDSQPREPPPAATDDSSPAYNTVALGRPLEPGGPEIACMEMDGLTGCRGRYIGYRFFSALARLVAHGREAPEFGVMSRVNGVRDLFGSHVGRRERGRHGCNWAARSDERAPWVGPIVDAMFEDVREQKLMREGKPLPARAYSEDTSPYTSHWWPESVKILHWEALREEDCLKNDFRHLFPCQSVVHPDRTAQSDNFCRASRLLNTKLVHTLMSDQFLTAWVTIDDVHLWGTHNDPRNPGTGGWATYNGRMGGHGWLGNCNRRMGVARVAGETATGGWEAAGERLILRAVDSPVSTVIAVWELCSANPGPRDGGNIGAGCFAWLRRLERQWRRHEALLDQSYTNILSITSLSVSNWDSWDRVPTQKLIAVEKNYDLRMSDTLCHRHDTCHFETNHPPNALFI
ncbi:hypothetical protein B0H14DRAFT_2636748 [Mycena olivaceomarginata]|nr:hypothetical protein B0H14DRAFT_2636748 [Mycena olivaceomarginata]